jgi:hypothetical protein
MLEEETPITGDNAPLAESWVEFRRSLPIAQEQSHSEARTELTLTTSECKTLTKPSFKAVWVQQSHPLKGIGNVKLISRIRVGFDSRYSCPEKNFVESPRLAKPWTFQVKLQLYWLGSPWPWSACGTVKTTVYCQWQPPMKLPRWTPYLTWWWLYPQVCFCW